MTYALAYSLVVNALFLLMARRGNDYERSTGWIFLLWPLSLLIGLASYTLHKCGWCNDICRAPKHLSDFGWRTPNDGQPGVAVRGFGYELQLWKSRK